MLKRIGMKLVGLYVQFVLSCAAVLYAMVGFLLNRIRLVYKAIHVKIRGVA